MKTVLVQAGHVSPREPGFESGTGTAGEQALVLAIRDALCVFLKADSRFKALPMPGKIPRGTRCDAALFLHADGSSNPKASGYSFGYPAATVNVSLARLIDKEFKKLPGHPPHHADNYTADMHGYYGFSRTDTPGPEVLVEHGFLTNPSEAAWLRAHVKDLAGAEYRALLNYFNLIPRPKPKPVPAPVTPVWDVTVTNAHGLAQTVRTSSPRLWLLRYGNFAKKGVAHVDVQRVEQA